MSTTTATADDLADQLSHQGLSDAKPDEGSKSNSSSEDDDDDDDDKEKARERAQKKLNRTYDILVRNETGVPLQLVAWPVRASLRSPFVLNTHRGANFHDSVPPAGALLSPSEPGSEPHRIATFRGPPSWDLVRRRWGWIFFDLVLPSKRRVHLQLYIRSSRSGIDKALLGRCDLDSSYDEPNPSGDFTPHVTHLPNNRGVEFVLPLSLLDIKNSIDDTVKKASLIRPGKGIDTLSYVSAELGKASLIVGKEARYHEYEPAEGLGSLASFKATTHEIEGALEKFVGVFVESDGKGWWDGSITVNPITGQADGKAMNSTAESTAIFGDGMTLSYGFHDAGSSRRDQLYIYLTPDHSNWLGRLIAEDPAWLTIPFSRLALAGSHDSGMFGPLDAGLATLIQEGHLGHALASSMQANIAEPFVKFTVDALELIRLKPDRVINNIALTQRDTFENQLKIGVRFFDFRPGHCFHNVIHTKKGRLHHQHAMVPGATYLAFLTDIFKFLVSHPSEIVFVELKSDGFVVSADKERDGKVVVYSMIPTPEELTAVLEEARGAVEGGDQVKLGGAGDLDREIGSLLEEGTRLLIVDRVHEPESWKRDDSYDHVAYNTDDPATIVAALEKTFASSSHNEEPTAGSPARGCIYQLQATPTANIFDDIKASLTWSDSSSLLTYMKPRQDKVVYPWIASHRFEEPGNIVFLNDFVEGVLVEHAIATSRQRAGIAAPSNL